MREKISLATPAKFSSILRPWVERSARGVVPIWYGRRIGGRDTLKGGLRSGTSDFVNNSVIPCKIWSKFRVQCIGKSTQGRNCRKGCVSDDYFDDFCDPQQTTGLDGRGSFCRGRDGGVRA